jgi:hypothetical protein
LGLIAGSLAAAYVLLALPFLVSCPGEYFKQNYVFHALRPYGGTAHPVTRLAEIWGYAWSWSTVRFALLGLAMVALTGLRGRRWEARRVVCIWCIAVLALLLSSRTYWATYFSQLAVPLSLLGGLLVDRHVPVERAPLVQCMSLLVRRHSPLLPAALVAGALVVGFPSVRRQLAATRAALEQTKPAYVRIADYLSTRVPADEPVLSFETNYTFLSSRPPAGIDGRGFFVDSYGQMLYTNLGVPSLGVAESVSAWLNLERTGSQAIFHREPAQLEVRRLFERTRYVVVDSRAKKQLTEATNACIVGGSEVLHSEFGAELRVRREAS